MPIANNTFAEVNREIVVFNLDDHEYGVEIRTVREIRTWTDATPLPHAPNYVTGVINLRGTVLPIIDLTRRFGLSQRTRTSRDVVMVVQVEAQTIGILVDAVVDILSITTEQVQPTPNVASTVTRKFVNNVVLKDERMIQLVRLDRLLELGSPEAA